jgi:hypothetical protein
MLFILTLTDQFGSGVGDLEAREAIANLQILIRKPTIPGLSVNGRQRPPLHAVVLEVILTRMNGYRKRLLHLKKLLPFALQEMMMPFCRYNACMRTVHRYNLVPRPKETREPLLE